MSMGNNALNDERPLLEHIQHCNSESRWINHLTKLCQTCI